MITLRTADLKNKRVLIRVDFNVPLNDTFQITDDKRMQESMPTIKFILEKGGSCILMSHLGRPKNGPEDKFSLEHLVPHLTEMLGVPVIFGGDCISNSAFEITSKLKAGQVVLLENLRFYKEEEKGDVEFSMKLAKHGDIYVNDAFGTAHRAHASPRLSPIFSAQNIRDF